MAPAAAHDHNAQTREHFAAIDRELSEERRRASFSANAIRPLRRELVDVVIGARASLDPEARGRHPQHVAALEHGFDRLESAVAEHGLAQSRSRRYSEKAHQAALPTYAMEVKIRERLKERLGTSPLAESVKREGGVGQNLSASAPLEVYDVGALQLTTLRNTKYAALFRQRGVDCERLAAQLDPLVATLKKEIDAGVGPGAKKGETSDRVAEALLWLDIAFERAVAFLEDWGAEDAAHTLRGRLPKRSRKAAGESDEKDLEKKQDGEGEKKEEEAKE